MDVSSHIFHYSCHKTGLNLGPPEHMSLSGHRQSMRVLFLTNGPFEHPTSRGRVYQYLDFLSTAGVQGTVSPGLSSKQYPVYWGTAKRTFARAVAANFLTAQHRALALLRANHYNVIGIQRN